ncbi:valine--tRNA ligase [Massilicoli timonensis]|uniref:valine--tRNA ligase n=1 Tax=Massilicoli timonensis TaxID=2015901 RepID=UPI00307A0D46
MSKALASKYDHHQVEAGRYDEWLKEGYFTAGDKSKDPFCIVIPPPNVTGKLHLGHAWDTTLQDMIARYKRLKGYDMLWVAGMDHAGIATQAKVDERLKQEGVSRYDIGREKFLERAWEWKEEYASTIRKQWAKLGLSLDYSRERFTLDEGLSKAVQKVFCDLYEEGLIYRGERIINWDPKAMTALSNIEVIHKEVEGKMYYFKYAIEDSEEQLIIATTRPETMFADQAVFVHPDDARYQHLIGKRAINPANGEALPIMADDYIDMSFGTAVMKCTPAHDPNDFALAKKYDLAMPICMNPDATMNALAGKYAGMDRFACREALVADFEAKGIVAKIETHLHQVGHSERTGVVVEPYLSKQWFVKMKPLAEDVLKDQADDEKKIHYYPPRFEKTFVQWLENIEDWCISRQLWWGHRIPAWYHKESGAVHVGEEPADSENWVQDEDVLDTWFSSALWPFSTLGWPDIKQADYQRYYPNDVLVTGYDIIFFWVARMAFQARHFTGGRPFKDVLIHGLIRDAQGRKMSKSLGNGVDPMDVIDQYGCDALRFFLTTNSTPGQDLRYIEEKVEASWNFINKIWNASRFVLMNLGDDFSLEQLDFTHVSIIDKWILKRLDEVLMQVEENMDRYEFALVGNALYSFVWDDFCSWYIELSKAGLHSEDEAVKQATRSTLVWVLSAIVRILHPFMPFVSEAIYQAMPHAHASINLETWPVSFGCDISEHEMRDVKQLLSMISAVREIKKEYGLKPSAEIAITIYDESGALKKPSAQLAAILRFMGHANWLSEDLCEEKVVRAIHEGTLAVALAQVVDVEAEIVKLRTQKEKIQSEIKRAQGMLNNPNFVNKAPEAKVAAEQEKLRNYQKQFDALSKQLETMEAKRNN